MRDDDYDPDDDLRKSLAYARQALRARKEYEAWTMRECPCPFCVTWRNEQQQKKQDDG